jgi:hypothetical protein
MLMYRDRHDRGHDSTIAADVVAETLKRSQDRWPRIRVSVSV